MAIDKKELTGLSPKERIKKLKLMEEERKKEVGEIEAMIRESMHALNTEKIAREFAPEPTIVDISRLFQINEGEMLERAAKTAQPAKAAAAGKNYQAITQTYEAYTQLTKEQRLLVGEIGERINAAEKYMSEGEKTTSKLDAAKVTLHKLKKETGLG